MPRNEAMPRQAGKRPVRQLSPQEKVNAIQRVMEGESKASVARDIGVPESTLRGWCKSHAKLLSQLKNQSSNYEGAIMPLESESSNDESRGSGSSRSPPNCIGVSNLANLAATNEELALKRSKGEISTTTVNNSMPNLMVNTSSQVPGHSYNGDFNALHYQRIINMINSNPEAARIIQQNSLYNALILNAQNGLQYSRNNGTISNINIANSPVTVANSTLTNNVVLNGANNESKRKPSSTTNTRQVLNSNKRHMSSIVEGAGTERSATPLTSGITNGGTIESSSSRPRQETRSFEEIMSQLRAQQLQQQQQTVFTEFLSQAYQRMCSSAVVNTKKEENNEVAERKKRLEEALEQNKNKSEVESRSRPNGVPEGIDVALNQARALEKWLKEYGSPYITLANLKPIQTIINKLQDWMEGGNRSEGGNKAEGQPRNNNAS